MGFLCTLLLNCITGKHDLPLWTPSPASLWLHVPFMLSCGILDSPLRSHTLAVAPVKSWPMLSVAQVGLRWGWQGPSPALRKDRPGRCRSFLPPPLSRKHEQGGNAG